MSDTDTKIRLNVTLWPWFLNFLLFYCQAEYAVVHCEHGKHFRFSVARTALFERLSLV